VAPARPYWKGYLKLSLVSCLLALYTASLSTERVSFRQIPATGNKSLDLFSQMACVHCNRILASTLNPPAFSAYFQLI